MKFLRKPVSAILALVLIFSTAVIPSFALNDKDTVPQEETSESSHSPLTTQQFVSQADIINDATEILLGFRLIPEDKLQITVNGYMNDIFEGIKEETGGIVDCNSIVNNLPALDESSKAVKTLLKLDMDVVAPALKEITDDYFRENQVLPGALTAFVRAYLLTIVSCEIDTRPDDDQPGAYDVWFTINYENGTYDSFETGMIYNSLTGTLENKDGKGMLGIGFNLDTEDYVITTVVNSWQRGFGFTMAYDIFCYVTKLFDYVTERIKFTYDNKEWMIQIWKGKYIIAPGAEIGIYTREIGAPGTFYNCAADEDMMVMSMELYHQEDLIFELEPTLHWWLTGFKLHPEAYAPESLTLHGTIEFPTVEMADLFVASAEEIETIETVQNGVNVSFVW